MQIFGLDIRRRKAAPNAAMITHLPTAANGWLATVRESFSGAWQRNLEVSVQDTLTYSAVFACVTMIASDIAKIWLNLVTEDADGICTPTENVAYSPVLRQPNHFQTTFSFIECWVLSRLIRGNAYILKERDLRGVVSAMYVLDPQRVQVLVAPDGSIYYQLGADYLSGLQEASFTVPQSEIIHDVMVPLYHPLCGVSPISACGLAAMQGLRIQNQSEAFFANNSQPGGLLMSPLGISEEAKDAIQRNWEANFSGKDNVGRIAVLVGGMTYTPLTPVSAHDAQLIEQLKWTAETVCSVFHVPAYKVGAAPVPVHNKPQDLTIEYYQQALQAPIEKIEQLLTHGLELKSPYSIEFDLDALLRMDTATAITSTVEGIKGGLMAPNEGRKKFDLKPVKGGDSVFLQQQEFSLEALYERDQNKPFAKPSAPPSATPAASPAAPKPTPDTQAQFAAAVMKHFADVDWSKVADAA